MRKKYHQEEKQSINELKNNVISYGTLYTDTSDAIPKLRTELANDTWGGKTLQNIKNSWRRKHNNYEFINDNKSDLADLLKEEDHYATFVQSINNASTDEATKATELFNKLDGHMNNLDVYGQNYEREVTELIKESFYEKTEEYCYKCDFNSNNIINTYNLFDTGNIRAFSLNMDDINQTKSR